MLFMVIEKFRDQDAKSVYGRFHEKGRLMPEGLAFISSWVSADLGRCFQVMACDDVALLQRWVAAWSDLVEFEIVPVTAGKDTADALAEQLARTPEGKSWPAFLTMATVCAALSGRQGRKAVRRDALRIGQAA